MYFLQFSIHKFESSLQLFLQQSLIEHCFDSRKYPTNEIYNVTLEAHLILDNNLHVRFDKLSCHKSFQIYFQLSLTLSFQHNLFYVITNTWYVIFWLFLLIVSSLLLKMVFRDMTCIAWYYVLESCAFKHYILFNI